MQMQVNINLSSTNSISWGLCDTANQCLKFSIGNTKDQLLCTYNDSLLYVSTEKLFDVSRFNLTFTYTRYLENAFIEIHFTTDSMGKIKLELPHFSPYLTQAFYTITQFGKTSIGQHEITNIGFSEYFKDTLSPKIRTATQISNTKIILFFNEPVLLPATNQFLINNLPAKNIAYNPIDFSVELNIPQNKKYTNLFIQTSNIIDEHGNITTRDSIKIPYVYLDTPQFSDVYFTEIMFDPYPNWGFIPEGKYIEIYNHSNKYFNANLLKLIYEGEDYKLPEKIIAPKEYYILSSKSDSALKNQGNWLGLSPFPGFSTTSGNILLQTTNNQTIDELTYHTKQHLPVLSEGGISLEKTTLVRISNNPWNWRSNNQNAGSPGQPNTNNSAATQNELVEYYKINDTLHLLFKDLLSKNSTFKIQNLNTSEVYSCFHKWGNKAFCPLINTTKHEDKYALQFCYSADSLLINDTFSLVAEMDSLGVIINEIMYDNYSSNVDFVELYNQHKQPVKLNQLFIEILDADGNLRNIIPCINAERSVIMPNEYLAISNHSVSLKSQFPSSNEGQFIRCDAFPNLLSTGGKMRLRNSQKTILDEVSFNDKSHSPWVENCQGYSLEKISPEMKGLEPRSWTTASLFGEGGTPGMENSVVKSVKNANSEWVAVSTTKLLYHFNEPLLLPIDVQLPQSGFILNVNLFNSEGQFIQNLMSEFPLPAESNFALHINPRPLPSSGNYILKFEALHPEFNVFSSTKRIAIVHK